MPRRLSLAVCLFAAMALAACGPPDPRAAKVLALNGDPARGQALYAADCSGCHTSTKGWSYAIGIFGAPGVVSVVIDGKGKMPAFARYSDQQLADLYGYLRTLT
jgi:mono/diheme cytochrome c family protein